MPRAQAGNRYLFVANAFDRSKLAQNGCGDVDNRTIRVGCARELSPWGPIPTFKSTTHLRHTCASSYRVIATRRARCCCPFRQQIHLHLCCQSTQIDKIMQNPNISQIRGDQIKLFISPRVKKLETPKSISIHFWTF